MSETTVVESDCIAPESYGVADISVLSDMQHIRTRYGMYIGDAVDPRQLGSEALDNALDESQAGHSRLTEVFIDTKNRVQTIKDYGRGIPIGITKNVDGSDIEVLQLLCTKSFSGGKFNGNNYRVRSGLNGVGLGCTNALSSQFEISTRRNGRSVYLACERGEVKQLIYSPTSQENGVTISFKGDTDIFDTDIIPIEFWMNRCKVSKAFGYPIDLYVDNSKVALEVDSLCDLMPLEEEETVYSDAIIKAEIESGEFINVAIRYTSETSSKSYGYTNLLFNRYGGTHVRLLDRAIETVWSEFYKEAPVALKPSDCKIGLRSLVAVFINEASFGSQTKDKLTSPNKQIQPLIDAFAEKYREWLIENPEMRQALLNRFSEYRMSQNKLTARKEIMELVKINESTDGKTVKRKSVVNGLIECTSSDVEGTELYIVEGNSAGGTAARARNKKKQSVLPMRGKIKNIAYMSIEDALKSEDIRKIVNATGAGVGEDTDPDRCRYEKVIISADADPDGKHITALEISVYVNLMPALVKAGRVYVLVPPLYGYQDTKNYVFTNEFDEIPEKLRRSKGFTRYKGLGEMDDDEFRQSCMTDGQRTLYQVQFPSDIDAFNAIMGSTSGRRNLLSDLGVIRYANGEEDHSEIEDAPEEIA